MIKFDPLLKVGDLVELRIAEVNANGDFFKQRHYWGVKEGSVGVVLEDNYGQKATYKRVWFGDKIENIRKTDLVKTNG